VRIVGLLLLIVGPFYLWWLGPIFGIIAVRAAASRWAYRPKHVATVVIVVLFSIQVVMALGLMAFALSGGYQSDALQRLFSTFAPGGAAAGPAFFPPAVSSAGWASLSPLELIVVLPAPLAGVSTGLYLALSPRYRR
jgi:hypothetical protein